MKKVMKYALGLGVFGLFYFSNPIVSNADESLVSDDSIIRANATCVADDMFFCRQCGLGTLNYRELSLNFYCSDL